MIRARDDILVLDVDHAKQRKTLRGVTRQLRDWGVEPVVVASGQRYRRHLFAWIESPQHLAYVRSVAATAGIDVRPSGHIRPPLSPHRSGCTPRLIQPSTPEEALSFLSTGPREWPLLPHGNAQPRAPARFHDSQVKHSLGPRLVSLLRDGDITGRYRSRSEVEMALFTGMAQAGWTFAEAFAALLDPDNEAGERLREAVAKRGEDRARENLERSFDKAVDRVDEVPEATDSVVAALRRHCEDWTGRTSKTDFVVYGAFLNHAEEAHTLDVNVSLRQLVEETGRAKGTVYASLKRLKANNYLHLVESGAGTALASMYRVKSGHLDFDVVATVDPPISHPNNLISGGSIEDPAHDIWANRCGLGAYAYRIYREILASPKSVEMLAEPGRCGTSKTIRKHLARMNQCGLVTGDAAGLWSAVQVSAADADQIAEELGTLGRGRRLREGHERERTAYAELGKRRQPPIRRA